MSCISMDCILMGTNCVPLLSYLFVYSYEDDFVHLQKSKFKKQKTSFNFIIDDY